ncbi:hypothetical protein HOY80DRAFT_471017 [Tuber brumale]|nr:hypothetical protein HOY80DRAFT_471017 [Tuber brumale]
MAGNGNDGNVGPEPRFWQRKKKGSKEGDGSGGGGVNIDVSPATATAAASGTAKGSEAADEESKGKEGEGEGGNGEKKKKEENVDVGNYIRILKFGDKLDVALMLIGAVTSFATGAAFPLMTLIFGELITNFSQYFMPGSKVTKAEFTDSVDTLWHVFASREHAFLQLYDWHTLPPYSARISPTSTH